MNRRKALLSLKRGLERNISTKEGKPQREAILRQIEHKLNETEQVKKDLFGLDK